MGGGGSGNLEEVIGGVGVKEFDIYCGGVFREISGGARIKWWVG